MLRFVGTPLAEYVVYTAVITGAAVAAMLANRTAKPAATAATRSLVMKIPCGRFRRLWSNCAPESYALVLPNWGILFKLMMLFGDRSPISQPFIFAGTLLVSAKVESAQLPDQ
jgi:hypothetical protein